MLPTLACLAISCPDGLSLSLSFGLFMPPWPAMRPATTPITTTMLFFSSPWLPFARFVLPLLRLLCLFSLSLLSAVAVCQPKLLHSKLSISQQQGKSCNFQLSPQLLAVSPSLDLLSLFLLMALFLSLATCQLYEIIRQLQVF